MVTVLTFRLLKLVIALFILLGLFWERVILINIFQEISSKLVTTDSVTIDEVVNSIL